LHDSKLQLSRFAKKDKPKRLVQCAFPEKKYYRMHDRRELIMPYIFEIIDSFLPINLLSLMYTYWHRSLLLSPGERRIFFLTLGPPRPLNGAKFTAKRKPADHYSAGFFMGVGGG